MKTYWSETLGCRVTIPGDTDDYEESAQAELNASIIVGHEENGEQIFRGEAMATARWQLQRQIARTADAQNLFLANGGRQSLFNPFWVAWQRALSAEMGLRRGYFDAFGVPYDGVSFS